MSEIFSGDFSTMWSLGLRKPIQHLTWDWWWWLLMLDDEDGNPSGKQLMVLWSTKTNDLVHVNKTPWKPQGRPSEIVDGAYNIDGMVCAWWYDGTRMYEPILKDVCKMTIVDDSSSHWPSKQYKSTGGGAIVPQLDIDCSMGLRSDLSSFWLHLQTTLPEGHQIDFNLDITPWNQTLSHARHLQSDYLGGMGYDILRIHGAKVHGSIDGKEQQGTAYFQKVCVQAPSPPWYWGVLHFDDGSYLDWFLPHLALTVTSQTSRPWKQRDFNHISLSQGGLFHDAVHNRTERFGKVRVNKKASSLSEANHGANPGAPLPEFFIELQNGRTLISIHVQAIERAHWHFDQPTRGGLWSHLTYNEYPLSVVNIEITDEHGTRTLDDYTWIRGNAEHSWGILH
jgi:hypothetical protein